MIGAKSKMGKVPTRSTLISHNAAFNLILDCSGQIHYATTLLRPAAQGVLLRARDAEIHALVLLFFRIASIVIKKNGLVVCSKPHNNNNQ